MKSKTLIFIVGGIVALMLLAGTCSAGFLFGRTFASETPDVSEVLPALGDIPVEVSTPIGAEEATPDDARAFLTANGYADPTQEQIDFILNQLQ